MITKPLLDPTYEGHTFFGWCKEKGLSSVDKLWDFNDVIEDNMILYAIWDWYVVKFDLQGGVGDFPDQVVYNNMGIQVSNSKIPVKEGFDFVGWYTELEYINQWNLYNDYVKSNMTLYAKWEKEKHLYNNYDYVINDGTAEILGYVGDEAVMYIPSEIIENGISYPVTVIAAGAIKGLNSEYFIYIPDSILEIRDTGDSTDDNFIECPNLRGAWLPNMDNVEVTKHSMFDEYAMIFSAGALKSGVLSPNHDGVRIENCIAKPFIVDGVVYLITGENEAKAACVADNRSSITIKHNVNNDGKTYIVTEIIDGGFNDNMYGAGDHTLTEVIIEDGILTIGNNAFRYLSALTVIKLSNTLVTIGDNVFWNLPAKGIKLPNTLVTIGNNCFEGMDHIGIVLPRSVINIDTVNGIITFYAERSEALDKWSLKREQYSLYSENEPINAPDPYHYYWHYNDKGEVEIWYKG